MRNIRSCLCDEKRNLREACGGRRDDVREIYFRSENNVAVRWYGGISSFAILETVKPIVVLSRASDKYDELSPLERATLERASLVLTAR